MSEQTGDYPPPTIDCEHNTVRGHLPYDGLAECCGCGADVYLHRPKRGPEGPGLPVPDYIGAALSGRKEYPHADAG